MRLAGRIIEWNDDKGYGFVVPGGGGDRAFLHVNDFQRGSRRPVVGDLVSYLPSRDERGRVKAHRVRHAGHRVEAPRPASRIPRAVVGGSVLAVVVILTALQAIPLVLGAACIALSALSYLVYWYDKTAARRGGQRTPESSLHLLALCGGWPGALIAQQHLRHKTIKQPFQTLFWVTVALNLAVMGWLVSSGLAAELAW